MGIAVAGATYAVNIELNTEQLKGQLRDLDTMVSSIGKQGVISSTKKNKTDEKGLKINGKSLAGEEKRLGLAIKRQKVDSRMRKLEKKGVQLGSLRNKQAGKYASMAQLTDAQKDKEWRVGKLIANNLSLEVKKIEDKIQRQNIQNAAKQKELNTAIKLRRLGDSAGSLGTKIGRVNRGSRVGPGGGAYGLPSSGMLNADARGIKNLNKIGSLEERSLRRAERKLRLEKEMTAENKKRNNIRTNIAGPGGISSGRSKRSGLGAIRDYRRGTVLQSAAISGAFPLLFGQGPVTAAAGAVGGGLGAKFGGQMGGFAGGLMATSVTQQISQAVSSVSQLGMALDPVRGSTDELVKAMGLTGTEFEKNIKAINTLGNKEAALSLARERMANLVGKKGVKALTDFGKNTARLASEWSKAMTQMGAAFAEFLEETGIVQWMTKKIQGRNLFSQAKKSEDPEIQRLWGLSKDAMLPPWAQSDEYKKDPKSYNEIVKEILERQKLINAGQDKASKMAAEQGARDAANLARVNDMYKQIGDTVKNGLVDGISAAIEGTKNLGEVASSVLKDIGRTILQYGINSFLVSLFPNNETWGKIFGRASGGPVTGGDPYVVGEKGPELFVPNSSGSIVPNHAVGGSMVVNVDASGSSAEGNDDRSRQLGELIGAAVQSELIRQQRPGGTLY